jgi:hypothetical protein
MTLIVLAIVVGSTIWVGFDHGKTTRVYGDEYMHTTAYGWMLGCIFLWIVWFPWYLVCRHRQRQPIPGPPVDYEDDNGVHWHRSPAGEWHYYDVAAGWVRSYGTIDQRPAAVPEAP